jgi:predicted 3-demethylubiquinone-9 3-methyltransferase (glyoxalase superfamily)
MAYAQKVSTCLWFSGNAEEAVNFYVSLLDDSAVTQVTHYGPGMPMPEGTVLTIAFRLGGTEFLALNGGPQFRHSEASSTIVLCDTQEEVDRLWSALTADGGRPVQCGWLCDRFGLSWQIVPRRMLEFLSADAATADRVMQAMVKMVKLDIAALAAAAERT